MNFLFDHLTYILAIFAMGTITGWMSYPLYQQVVKPALARLFKK